MAEYRIDPPILTARDIARFWSRVAFVGDVHACWEWKNSGGKHGVFAAAGRMLKAQRVAFFLITGEWPPVVMHWCDNPPCCNPLHERSGTQIDNIADATSKGRVARGDRNGSRTHLERLPRGERNVKSRLTSNAVLWGCAQVAKGASQQSVARELGVSVMAVNDFIRGRTWVAVTQQHRAMTAAPAPMGEVI